MNLGVHKITKNSNSTAYFVQRSFGNYLIYPDALASIDVDFLKSRGGVYKQFISKVELISLAQVQVFIKFGASAVVGADQKDKETDSMPIEVYGEGFKDPSIKLNIASFGASYWMMKQKDKKVIFLSPELYFDKDEIVLLKGKDISEDFYTYFESIGASYLFFTEHHEESHYITLD